MHVRILKHHAPRLAQHVRAEHAQHALVLGARVQAQAVVAKAQRLLFGKGQHAPGKLRAKALGQHGQPVQGGGLYAVLPRDLRVLRLLLAKQRKGRAQGIVLLHQVELSALRVGLQ